MYNEMDLPIRMRFIYNVKHRCVIYLKFVDKFLTSLTTIVLELYVYEMKSTFILSQVFGICYHCHKLTYFNNKVCPTKKDHL